MYEFVGPNPAGLRGEVAISHMQVSEFFEPIGMFHRNFPSKTLVSLPQQKCEYSDWQSKRPVLPVDSKSLRSHRPLFIL
eukprot:COSAG02_NODE_6665_length_3436_cov_157.242497_7_plen_79_part_00